MIRPHGGRLIDRHAKGEMREAMLAKANELPKIQVNERELADIEMIGCGAMSPLEGFMNRDDYLGVLNNMHLASGPVWTLPITLSVKPGDDRQYKIGDQIALVDQDTILAVMDVEDVYQVDHLEEAKKVYLTDDPAHPSVAFLQSLTDTYLGGPITVLNKVQHPDFNEFRLEPKETRVLFKAKGWNSIVAFQTRNPIHRAHEYLQKCALEQVDALLIHPLMGATKKGDIPGDVRMACYKALIDGYYAKERVAVSIFPAAMRYAGPREAIFHALVRKNYGCTHFIVGRDHAGVGTYYGTYDAQYIFDNFTREEIDITPMMFEHSFFCNACGNMASIKTCPHGKEEHVFLSGTKVREMLAAGQRPPQEFTRPEVADILMKFYQSEEA
ncbi:MAG TPA: sulfate adenylyltransferase [bacterium]|nr:sulfate adenylyltransferase [bacterium]